MLDPSWHVWPVTETGWNRIARKCQIGGIRCGSRSQWICLCRNIRVIMYKLPSWMHFFPLCRVDWALHCINAHWIGLYFSVWKIESTWKIPVQSLLGFNSCFMARAHKHISLKYLREDLHCVSYPVITATVHTASQSNLWQHGLSYGRLLSL